MNFYGFKINTKQLGTAEKVIDQIKATVHEKAQKLYAELLSREIQILVDEIVLGEHNNERIGSIFDASVELLNKKIAIAMAKGLDTEYNFNVALNMFYYDKAVYIQEVTTNYPLFECIKSIPALIDYHIDDMLEQETRVERVKTWEKIVGQYKDHSCFVMKIFPLSNPFNKPDFKDLKFSTPEVRADILARQRLTNKYLSQYAGGGNIPPSKLMEYLDQTYLKISGPECKELLERYKSDLLRCLPVISEEIVMQHFSDQAPAGPQLNDMIYNKISDTFTEDEDISEADEET